MSILNSLNINGHILKHKKLRFYFISSNMIEEMFFCKYLEQNMFFQKVDIDTTVTVDVIIILRHGNSDYIETISKKQQLALLISEYNLDIQDRNLFHTILEQSAEVIHQIPVFVLHYTSPEISIKQVCAYLNIM